MTTDFGRVQYRLAKLRSMLERLPTVSRVVYESANGCSHVDAVADDVRVGALLYQVGLIERALDMALSIPLPGRDP